MYCTEYPKYTDAVEELLFLAYMDCGGARIAAQVLLSAYNSSRWKLELGNLIILEGSYFQAAMDVIHYRIRTIYEPNDVIENGNKRLEELHHLYVGTSIDFVGGD